MKRNTITSFALFVVILMMGACGNNAWDELPRSISSFVSEYFPFGEVQSYTEVKNGSIVKIKNGATLTFDQNYEWTDVNGNGTVLPQNFLFDKLPDTLYDYIESMESVNDVYRVSRSANIITVEFPDSTITYDSDTGTITYPSAS